jgi:hypothetical protein
MGGVFTLRPLLDDEPTTPKTGWVLFTKSEGQNELADWFAERGYCAGLVKPQELRAVVAQVHPLAVLLDCPLSSTGITCEEMRSKLCGEQGLKDDPLLLVTKATSTHRFNCGHLHKKIKRIWTNESLGSYSSPRLCQLAPFNLQELEDLILEREDEQREPTEPGYEMREL